jgi:hypothetical protein
MEKIYCGSGKTRSGQFGDFQAVSICLDDIPSEHITSHENGKRYVNLTVSKKKEVDKYGKDLSVVVDTWKPEKSQTGHTPKAQVSHTAKAESEDLPF